MTWPEKVKGMTAQGREKLDELAREGGSRAGQPGYGGKDSLEQSLNEVRSFSQFVTAGRARSRTWTKLTRAGGEGHLV
jgi:hypothetical protein